MKAILYDQYGPANKVLYVGEAPEPVVKEGCARVHVHACALNPKDVLIRKGKMRWLSPGGFPRCSGYDFAGELMDDVPGLKRGTPVFGMIQDNQGRGCAEVISVPFHQFAAAPEELSMEEAAAIPLAALTALQAMRDRLGLEPKASVLLNGASGGVGTFAVQIARAMRLQVTAVCSSKNVAFVRELGAQRVIAYDEADVFELRRLESIFDIYGNIGWTRARDMLVPEGKYCTTVPDIGSVIRGVLARMNRHRAEPVVVKSNRPDLNRLAMWVRQGKLAPQIDQIYDMSQAVEAHEHLETRRTRGKVVLRLA